jgi:AraC family transcriptional regulator
MNPSLSRVVRIVAPIRAKRGVSVYHPRAFQHCDEIGRDGGLFFGVQLSPNLLRDADRAGPGTGHDLAILDDGGAYVVLGSLYAAPCTDAGQLALESLAAELASHLMTPELSASRAMPAWLVRTEHRLRDEQHVSLHELARDAGVHATTLTRLFRRHKKCSIGEFHARARARRAFFAVVGSGTPLSEICHDAGYADQSHMTRDFGRAFGATPGQLRRASLDA